MKKKRIVQYNTTQNTKLQTY